MYLLFLAALHSLGLTQRKLRDIVPERAEKYYHTLDTKTLIESGYTLDSAMRIVDKKTETLVEHVEHLLRENAICLVHIEDDEYPALLKVLPDAPTILYVR